MKAFAKSLSIFLLAICFFLTVIGLIFFDNIKGYYTFKEYCEKEGGLTVYEPLEKNVGWLADDKFGAMSVAQLDYIGFSRFFNVENGSFYDVQYKGSISLNESSYEILSAQINKEPVYKWKSKQLKINSEQRLNMHAIEIFNIQNNKLVAKYNVYLYDLFDRDKAIFDMPSRRVCHVGKAGSATTGFALSIEKINTAFTK